MDKAKTLPTPMTSNLKLSKDKDEPIENVTQYRSIVGGLQYATICRPDICFSVNKVCQYMQAPINEHWRAVKRILRYLRGTTHYVLRLESCKDIILQAYSDLDWANDVDDRRSTTGYCVYLGSNPISWCTKKQSTVSRSSTEAEYRAIANATVEITWTDALLGELGLELKQKSTIWVDNLSAISLSMNPVQHSRTKHHEIDLHFVREQTGNGKLQIRHIPYFYQRADILTKAISSKNFTRLREEL